MAPFYTTPSRKKLVESHQQKQHSKNTTSHRQMKPVLSVDGMAVSVWRAGTLSFVCVWNSDDGTQLHTHTHRKIKQFIPHKHSTEQNKCTSVAIIGKHCRTGNFFHSLPTGLSSGQTPIQLCLMYIKNLRERWRNVPHSEHIHLISLVYFYFFLTSMHWPLKQNVGRFATIQELVKSSKLLQAQDKAMSNLSVRLQGPVMGSVPP